MAWFIYRDWWLPALIGIALANLNSAFDASDGASLLQLVPAHNLAGHVADESDTLLPEISFHKLGNAPAKAIRRFGAFFGTKLLHTRCHCNS